MAILQFPQPKLAEKTGEGVWRLTGRVILPESQGLYPQAPKHERTLPCRRKKVKL